MNDLENAAKAAYVASCKFHGQEPQHNAWRIPAIRDYWLAIVKAILIRPPIHFPEKKT